MRLKAEEVSVELGSRRVLDGIAIDLAPGEIAAVIGPNGAGKSTLLKTLAGLLPLSTGSVHLDGKAIGTWDRQALARHIAYLPQDRTVHWPLSVRAVVALGRLPHGGQRTGPEANDAIARAMSAMDVANFAGRRVTELSGGERARVLLARALAQETAILIADEPTAGLDPAHALVLMQHFVALGRSGHAIVMATHDLMLAARFCHRVLLLKNGRALAFGVPDDVLAADRLGSAFDAVVAVGVVGGVPAIVPIEPQGQAT